MTRLPPVYIAANSLAYNEVAALQRDWCDRLHFTSRWPFVMRSYLLNEHDPAHMRMSWHNNILDIQSAEHLVVLAPESFYNMRGSLVEVGIAIASHLHVVLVGEHEDFGSWQFHPAVRAKVATVEDAFRAITCGYEGVPLPFVPSVAPGDDCPF